MRINFIFGCCVVYVLIILWYMLFFVDDDEWALSCVVHSVLAGLAQLVCTCCWSEPAQPAQPARRDWRKCECDDYHRNSIKNEVHTKSIKVYILLQGNRLKTHKTILRKFIKKLTKKYQTYHILIVNCNC